MIIFLKVSDIRSWQDQCSYVPQTFYLNNSTIIENIAFAKDRDEIDLIKSKKSNKFS